VFEGEGKPNRAECKMTAWGDFHLFEKLLHFVNQFLLYLHAYPLPCRIKYGQTPRTARSPLEADSFAVILGQMQVLMAEGKAIPFELEPEFGGTAHFFYLF
jgi:hypothetical protein